MKKYEFPYLSTAPSIERAESYMHFRSRIGVFLNEMIERYPEGRVAAVCHGGVVNAVFDHVFNVGPYRRCEVWVRNTAYCHFQYRFIEREEPWLLHECGCTEHLAGIR
jgi:probable phosphoglycerate mutase